MNTLDRYIARQYLLNILILLAVLAGFAIIVDTAYNLDKYARAAEDIAQTSSRWNTATGRFALTAWAIIDFWWPWVLYLFSFLLGMLLVVGMAFTMAQMVRHREMVAVVAGGVSLHRIGRPILITAAFLSLLSIANQELVLPRIAPMLTRDQEGAGRVALASQRVPLTADAQGRMFYARAFDPTAQRLEGLYIIERDPQTGAATREIAADAATWTGSAWTLERPTVVGNAPGTTHETAPTSIATTLDPLSLKVRLYQRYGNTLSTTQAFWVARQVRATGGDSPQALRVADQMVQLGLGRLSTIVTNLLVLTIALCFFLTREPVNMFFQALKSAPIGLVGLIGGAVTKSAAIPGLPAFVSVFVPVLILTPIAVAVWSRVRT